MFNWKKRILLLVAFCGVGTAGFASSGQWDRLISSNPVFYEFNIKLQMAKKVLSDQESLELIQSILENPEKLARDYSIYIQSFFENPEGDFGIYTQMSSVFERSELIRSLDIVKDEITDDETKELVQKWLADHSLLKDPDARAKARSILKRERFLRRIEKIRDAIRDPATGTLVASWFETPSLLDSLEAQKQADKIIRRVGRVKELLKIVDKIRDIETKKLVDTWLSNTPLLDVPANYSHSMQILDRVKVVRLLIYLQPSIKNPDDKEKVEKWLNNTPLLDDPVEQDVAYDVISRAEEHVRLARLARLKKVRGAGILFYTIYRKLMFVRAIDRGEGMGYAQSVVNGLAALSYLGSGAYQMFLEAHGDFMTMALSGIMNKDLFSDLMSKGVEIRGDEVTSYIKEQIGDKAKARIVEEVRSGCKLTKEDCNRFVEEATDKVRKNVKEHGCPGMDLDFFDTFDKYLDRRLEKKIDGVLQSLQMPSFVRATWRNRTLAFTRRMLLCKVFPTYLYWKGKVWLRGHDGKYVDYVPFKEAIKSVGYSLRGQLESIIIRFINGKTNEDGNGCLDIAKEYTFGIFGPSVVPFILRMSVPFVVFSIANKMKQGFLTKRDLGIEDRDWKKHLARSTIGYASGRVVTHFLLKIFAKIRPTIVGCVGDRLKKFLYFLSRRGFISPGIPEFFDQQSMFAQELKILIASAAFSLYNMYYSSLSTSKKAVKDYDLQCAYEETMKNRDWSRLIDYILASSIGRFVGKEFSDWTMNKLEEAHVF
jgi:hypothetical protein